MTSVYCDNHAKSRPGWFTCTGSAALGRNLPHNGIKRPKKGPLLHRRSLTKRLTRRALPFELSLDSYCSHHVQQRASSCSDLPLNQKWYVCDTLIRDRCAQRTCLRRRPFLACRNSNCLGLGTSERRISFPRMQRITLKTYQPSWIDLSYAELAFQILSLYISTDDIPSKHLKDIINRSYSTFRAKDITPLVHLQEKLYLLELFHGPSYSFKDCKYYIKK